MEQALMTFLALTQDSLSLIGLIPRFNGLSLIMRVCSGCACGTAAEGWASGMGAGAGTGTGTGIGVSDKSKEAGFSDPSMDKATERPPVKWPPILEGWWRLWQYPPWIEWSCEPLFTNTLKLKATKAWVTPHHIGDRWVVGGNRFWVMQLGLGRWGPQPTGLGGARAFT